MRLGTEPKRIWPSSAKHHKVMIRDTWPQQLRAVKADVEQLIIQAQRENGVALGIDMYEAKRMEHKTDDSDPSDGEDDGGYEEPYGNLDYEAAVRLAEEADSAIAAPQPPPVDANEATVRLACFRPAGAGLRGCAPLGPNFFKL